MDFVIGMIEAGAFVLCSFRLFQWQTKLIKVRKMLEFVNRAHIMSPGLLKKAMDDNSSQYLQNGMMDFEEGKNYSRGLAFVQGIVGSNHVMRSVLNHSTKLVLSCVSSELIFSNNKNVEEGEGKIDTKYVHQFDLSDPALPDEKISLFNSSNIQYSDALNLVHSVVHMRGLSTNEKILSWLIFCVKLFLSTSNVGKKLSGFKVGSKRVERGITVGQFMMAFGEVIYDKYNKELHMTNPIYFLKDREQLIYKLKERRSLLKRNQSLIFCAIAIIAIFMTKRMTSGVKLLLQKYRSEVQKRKLDPFSKLKWIYTNDFKCSICSERVKNVIFKPCLHLAVCQVCSKNLPNNRCPQCEKPVEDMVTLYVS